jgi:hypothetical protein
MMTYKQDMPMALPSEAKYMITGIELDTQNNTSYTRGFIVMKSIQYCSNMKLVIPDAEFTAVTGVWTGPVEFIKNNCSMVIEYGVQLKGAKRIADPIDVKRVSSFFESNMPISNSLQPNKRRCTTTTTTHDIVVHCGGSNTSTSDSKYFRNTCSNGSSTSSSGGGINSVITKQRNSCHKIVAVNTQQLPNLHDLPFEALARVCKFLSYDQVINLKAVCKPLKQNIEKNIYTIRSQYELQKEYKIYGQLMVGTKVMFPDGREYTKWVEAYVRRRTKGAKTRRIILRWENQKGQLESPDGNIVSEMRVDGTRLWHLAGKLHREDLPASISSEGVAKYFHFGNKLTNYEAQQIKEKRQQQQLLQLLD